MPPLMTCVTPVMFPSFNMLLLVLADLHGEMGGGSGLLDGMYIDENCVFFVFLFLYQFLCSHLSSSFE